MERRVRTVVTNDSNADGHVDTQTLAALDGQLDRVLAETEAVCKAVSEKLRRAVRGHRLGPVTTASR